MKIHRQIQILTVVLSLCVSLAAYSDKKEKSVVKPFEKDGKFTVKNEIDKLVLEELKEQGVKPAGTCSDEVFVRRVFLDVIGTLPKHWEVKGFLNSKNKNKRADLINRLLKRKEFADYWSLKWCDLLRVKAEFPINLWPNAVQAYHRWIYDSLKNNMPYDKFARELLTSSGSNFRVPQVNFYRAVQGNSPSALAKAAALTFMGVRFDKWPESKQKDFEAFFSRVSFKKTAEWKEEIVCLNPAPAPPLKAVFPDGKSVEIPYDKDPRKVFANWLISKDNPWFARNIVNRVWSWFFGRGIIHEPDDIREDNPPVNPKLLKYLEKELVKSNYDLKHIYRLILNSSTYQQSSIPQDEDLQKAEKFFACYPPRQLDAEVLIDALCYVTGPTESYRSPIPEPFTFVPGSNRSITLADGSITSQFLEMFGRPSRDTGLESERNNVPSKAQKLHLLNSTHIQNKLERSWRLKRLVKSSKGKRDKIINVIYMDILSRYPSKEEKSVAEKYFNSKGINKMQASMDIAWALINSKEFLFRH